MPGDRVHTNRSKSHVISELESIRRKQRQLYAQLIEAEVQQKELCEVSRSLQRCPSKQPCSRLMSGILVRTNVKTVLPMLYLEKDKVECRLDELQSEIRVWADRLKEYLSTHKICVSRNLKIDPNNL